MTHLESHIKAQKITCLKRYYQDYPLTWKNILDFYLKNVGERFLLKCNFLVFKLQLQLPEYYKECLIIWNSLQQPVPSKTDQEMINEYIWNNKQILIENRTVYSKNLRDKGLLKINDLLNLQGGFMKVEELLASGFTCTESFLLMSCIDALPSQWRKQLKFTKERNLAVESDEAQLWIDAKFIKISKLTQKAIYSELVSKITSIPTAQKRFSALYPDYNFKWNRIYEIPFKVTTNSKTRQFQYRILNRILYTNKLLYKMKITDTFKCTFCNEEDETIQHLLFSCKYTELFWKEIIKWLKRFQILLNPFVETSILFGILKHKHFKLINHLIIIGKQVIYTCRYRKIIPNFQLFLSNIRRITEIEINIAQRRGALDNYYMKWNNIVNWLQDSV